MKLIVCGAAGRMGQAILRLAHDDKEIEIVGAVEYDQSPAIKTGNPQIIKTSDLETILPKTQVIIDFTNPQSTLATLKKAQKFLKPVVIGTTGFTDEQKTEIKSISKTIPILLSPNMSIGVNVFFNLIKETAKKLSDYDIEIVEIHHNKKKDAPSGTAFKLAEIAAEAIGEKLEDAAVYERHSVNKQRSKNEIGISSVRAGDVVGDHTVYFAGQGERIELTHRAHSRDTFASGALRAANWIFDKSAGLYNMQDVLGLKEK
jgi:4-hydroxy-tetrahydrodipicolinate reductase